MNRRTRLSSQPLTGEQQALARQQAQQNTPLEFPSPEAMLRHDALHTVVPPRIARRLKDSTHQPAAPPRRAWWRRLLGETGR